jgi:predicted permease
MLSFLRLMRVERGFETAHVITQDVSFLSPKFARGVRRQYLEDLIAKLSSIPGVTAAGAVSHLPLGGEEWVSGLRDMDVPGRDYSDSAIANFRFVTPNYWKAAGIPLKQGRYLEDADRNLPRAVISARAAQYLWPSQNPIGRHVRGAGPSKPALEVVGVVGEVRQAGLDHDPPMMVYEHFWRIQPAAMSLVLRTQSEASATARAIRAVISAADPEMAVSPARTMEQIVGESVAARRFELSLAVAFAIAALLLASLGIYGVISFAVARRTPEIGIRIALGASRSQLLAMVVRQGMTPVVLGLGAGVAAALAGGRWIASELYGVSPGDPATISAVAVMLLAVALAACWVPARRAGRIDPLQALRFE